MDTFRSDVIVIGAGLSGMTAAALLAKRGLNGICQHRCHNFDMIS